MTASKYAHESLGSSSASSSQLGSPLKVLGVALIVDQKGAEARLVARYPTQPSSNQKPTIVGNDLGSSPKEDHPPQKQQTQQKPQQQNTPPQETPHADDELFFSLTGRQMAKLFRTKKTLCGSPMTLAIDGTVFCCRAVLMQGDEGEEPSVANPSASEGGVPTHQQLDLFSVIVALSSNTSHTSLPFTSWVDTDNEDQLDIQRYIRESTAAASDTDECGDQVRKPGSGRVSSAFLSVRRVHISLARYCRVLEREERRCHYISLQATQLFGIRSAHQKRWEEAKTASLFAGKGGKERSTNGPGSASGLSAKSSQPMSERLNRHMRTGSLTPQIVDDVPNATGGEPEFSVREEQEKEQEILELMLATKPPDPPSGTPKHHGNIVQELVQVFHSLSRNDQSYPQTATSLLIERDGVVYVNRHIAIPVEAASLKPSQTPGGARVRPYYTLLFPHASPSGLLQAFQSSGSAPPQRLQQLLLTVNAQKPLTDIAVDANLPLYSTLEMASYLVAHGACVASPVVSRYSRLACLQVERIAELGLEFSQLFRSVHLFRLVAFLTSAKTLGEAMSILTDADNASGAWLRECLAPWSNSNGNGSTTPRTNHGTVLFPEEPPPKVGPPPPSQDGGAAPRWEDELEQQLYGMAVWLLSHRVLTQLQEYLVVVGAEHDDLLSSKGPQPTPSEADQNLFREFLESEFLNGDVSIMALSWRLGLNPNKVRSWGIRHRRVRVVSRAPRPGDDWDP